METGVRLDLPSGPTAVTLGSKMTFRFAWRASVLMTSTSGASSTEPAAEFRRRVQPEPQSAPLPAPLLWQQKWRVGYKVFGLFRPRDSGKAGQTAGTEPDEQAGVTNLVFISLVRLTDRHFLIVFTVLLLFPQHPPPLRVTSP